MKLIAHLENNGQRSEINENFASLVKALERMQEIERVHGSEIDNAFITYGNRVIYRHTLYSKGLINV